MLSAKVKNTALEAWACLFEKLMPHVPMETIRNKKLCNIFNNVIMNW